MDPLDKFKAMQKEGWAHFVPLEAYTMGPAAGLVRFAGVRSGDQPYKHHRCLAEAGR